MAATRMSARRITSGRSRVFEWQIVTVALAWSRSRAMGLPTMSLRPRTTALAPSIGILLRRSNSMQPAGVQATRPGRLLTSLPTLTGWKPKLDEDAVHAAVGVEVADELQHVIGGDAGGRGVQPTGNTELFAGGDFAFDIELRGGIFADEDGGKAGADALRMELDDIGLQFGEDFVADFQAVEDACGH